MTSLMLFLLEFLLKLVEQKSVIDLCKRILQEKFAGKVLLIRKWRRDRNNRTEQTEEKENRWKK